MAVYLLNILPSRAINNEIPFTPDYSVLRVFGCLCYPHIDTNHKLSPRATPAIFLGHAANHFGYRCLDLDTNKIIISRHVTFDEMVFLFQSHPSKPTTLVNIPASPAPPTPPSSPQNDPLPDPHTYTYTNTCCIYSSHGYTFSCRYYSS